MGWLKQQTGTYAAGHGVLAAMLILAAIAVVAIGRTIFFASRSQRRNIYADGSVSRIV